MKILFIHQNFPGQFKHLAPALASAGHEVLALTMQAQLPRLWQGVEVLPYQVSRGSTRGIHPWLVDLETKVIRGQACSQAAMKLRDSGYTPDLILAHPGWGESLFLKEIWPQARLGIYCELYYHAKGQDVGFDPALEAPGTAAPGRIKLKNLNYQMHFDSADGGLAPTQWQAGTFPEPFRSRIRVIHDGIDTEQVAPNPQAGLRISANGGEPIDLSPADEIITFVNRNLEPYRGYHIFMRALPDLLQRRPKVRVLILGGDGTSYGSPPADGRKWKDVFINEVRPRMDASQWARVHFLGNIAYPNFITLLQLSTVHVYLTYPFVLSWSLLEAMSAGCAIVASNTAPVLEAIQHDQTGRLVDFFDVQKLTDEVVSLLDDAPTRERLGAAARRHAQATYDLQTVCLPQQIEWVESLVPGLTPATSDRVP